MNIKTVKKASERIDIKYLSNLKIKSYGYDNLYPQKLSDIVLSSSTGIGCLNRYARFIEGNGFLNVAFSESIVNRSGETADEIQSFISYDIAMFGGFALHVNYDLFGNIVELNYVPFENCRLEEEDDLGFVANIVIHPDWKGKKTRNGKVLRVDENSIKRLPVFNPKKEVVFEQIEKSGGIEFYNGQILYTSILGKNKYPIPKADGILSEMSTDEGLSNVKSRNVRNNFLPAGILFTYKGQGSGDDVDYKNTESVGYSEELESFQGDENALNILNIEMDSSENRPEFKEFPVRNFDKDFSVTDASTVERIYSAFEQEIFYSIRIGKLGFSGDVIRDAYSYYSSLLNKEHRMVERAFDTIFRHWHEDLNITKNYSINPLKHIVDEPK